MADTKKKTTEEETVTIKLPILGIKDKSDVFVSVNERTWLIKRGVDVEVPVCVAEVLKNQEMMQMESEEFQSANEK